MFDPTGTPSYVVRGRVIDERGGPLPEIGVTVRLWHDQGTYEDRVPGPAGEFRFEFGALGRHSKLWVNLPSSRRRRTDLLMLQSSLTPEQLSGEDEVRLLIAERLRGPVLGVAVDSKTGAPLADLHLTIKPTGAFHFEHWFEEVDVVTDAAGRFTTASEIVGGGCFVYSDPGEPRLADRKYDNLVPRTEDAEPWVLPFLVGGQFDVQLEGAVPADLTTLRSWSWYEGQAFQSAGTPLRIDSDTGRVWIRFSYDSCATSRRRFIAIGDEVGLIIGVVVREYAARVGDWLPRPADGPLRVVLERTAALKLTIALEEAPRVDIRLSERQARVEIESLDESASDPSLLWRIERRAGLRPGDHLVRASTNQHGVRERVVSLQGGRLSKVELMLQLERGLRTIHGELRTESGAVPPSALLTVRLRDDPDRTWLGNFEAQRSAGDVSIGRRFGLRPGETTASFNFMNVPVGALEAKVEGPRDPVSIRFTDRADGGVDMLVVVLDGTEGIGFGFCVLGPDGEPLGQRRVGRGLNMSLQTRKNGERSTWSSRVFDGRILERVDPRPEDFEWAVSTWRHRPVYGTSKDFVEEEPGRFFAPLRIERGWGTRVLVRTEDGQAVADCAIHVDGRRVGRTNASGWFDVELDESPERIGIELDDWLIVRHPDDSGGKPGESAWHEFVVRRANTPTRRVSAP